MSKKLRVYLLAVFSAVLALTLFAGCKLNPTIEDVVEKNNLKAVVTYYANGGNFGGTATEKSLYYPEGAKPLNIGVDNLKSGSIVIQREDFEFAGWYHAPLGENGLPVFNEGTNIVAATESDVQVDFTVALKDGDHLYVYAKWVSIERLEIKLITDNGADLTTTDGENVITYKSGDTLKIQSFNGNSINRPSRDPVRGEVDNFTFAEYYTDENCEHIVEWPIASKNSNENQTIYARYIPGSWEILKNASDITSANFGLSFNHYYLICDIDMQGGNFPKVNIFNCELQGNGFTIKNATLTVEKETFLTTSLFGSIESETVINNITFENITFNVNLGRNQYPEIYLFASSVNSAAVITDVEFGGALNITTTDLSKVVQNIQSENGVYNTSHWIIGGGESDEANLSAFSGLTLTDLKLIIDGAEIPLQ